MLCSEKNNYTMKKKDITISLCFLWGISIMVVFYAVYKYIDKKETTLRCELRDNITSLFQGQNSDGPLTSSLKKHVFYN